MKKLFQIYNTYGKHSGEELSEEFVAEDSVSTRQGIIDDFCAWKQFYYESPEDFTSGEVDHLTYSMDGGDWDDPTGGYITVKTFQEALAELIESYSADVERIDDLFGDDLGDVV